MAKKSIVKFDQISDIIIELRGKQVLIDADVAASYGVETKEINQAVKNNPKKFPKGYVFTANTEEAELVKNFDRFTVFLQKNGSNMAISDTKFHNKYRIQSTRAEWHDYNGGLYHVTLCTKNREHYLGDSLHDINQRY